MICKKEKNYWQQDFRKFDYWKAAIQGILLITFVAYLFYGTFLSAVLLMPYLFWYLKSWEKDILKQKQHTFRLQFKEAIQSMSSALSVGYSVENAMGEALKDMQTIYKKDELILNYYEIIISPDL